MRLSLVWETVVKGPLKMTCPIQFVQVAVEVNIIMDPGCLNPFFQFSVLSSRPHAD